MFYNISPVLASAYGGIILIYGFFAFDKTFKIGFKKLHYIFIILIAVTGPGLLIPLMKVFPYFDKLFHFLHPILFSSIVFFIVSKLKIKKIYVLFLVFFIVVASFAIFEVIEYSVGLFSDYKVQGSFVRDSSGVPGEVYMSPFDDTMIDLILDIAGAFVYLLFSLFDLKGRKN